MGAGSGMANWRNSVGADIVVTLTMAQLIPDATAAGGMRKISGLSPSWGDVLLAKNGYSIVVLPYADANLSFLHELGHQFGARHNPRPKEPQDAWYGRGFKNACTWRTIMAYDDDCRDPGAPRYLLWSSCNLWQDGVQAGSPLQNNVRVINENAGKVGGFLP